MKKQIILGGLAVAGFLLISGTLFAYQKERWEGQYAMGTVGVVGTRRIDLRNPTGKQFFAELSPKTKVLDGTKEIHPSQLPAGVGIVVLGKWTSFERIQADVIRVVRPQRE